jgi:starch synthase
MSASLRVLFLAAEAHPFIKIGGLGDVAGSLPQALRAIPPSPAGPQVDVRVVIPLHGGIHPQDFQLQPVTHLDIPCRSGKARAEVFHTEAQGVSVYFIGGDFIHPDAPVYTTDAEADGLKFTFFSLAALELARHLDWNPHVIHANDWHTAPAVYSLSLHRSNDPFYYNTAALVGLHNLPYLGVGSGPALSAFGLPPAHDSPLPPWARHAPMPLALLTADHIVAPSPSYAREIMTPEFGSGLHELLRTRRSAISGILNGIDVERWDPERDPFIAQPFSASTIGNRAPNKSALLAELGLDPDPQLPLLAMVGRMDHQKGFDLIPAALRQIASRPWQFVILGTGDPTLEASMRDLAVEFPGRVRLALRYDAPLSHRIYAGADLLLIPSRYEPCGLIQMIGMRYGCVPLARATGGLRDTIQDVSTGPGSTGFLFHKASPAALATGLRRALDLFPHHEAWQGLQQRSMRQDFSWRRSALQYRALYASLSKPRRLAPGRGWHSRS